MLHYLQKILDDFNFRPKKCLKIKLLEIFISQNIGNTAYASFKYLISFKVIFMEQTLVELEICDGLIKLYYCLGGASVKP